MIIGLMCGREYSFPPAFIERVNALGKSDGIIAEMVQLGGTMMGEPARYRVIVDRISHEVDYYRGYLKYAVHAGHVRDQQSILVDGGRQIFQLLPGSQTGRGHPEDSSPAAEVVPRMTWTSQSESLRNLEYPLDWDAMLDSVGRPAFLKPFTGGGWKNVYKVNNREELLAAYDQTGPYCMALQELIEFEEYVRCFTFGKSDILPVPYDPHERRYLHKPGFSLKRTGRAHRQATRRPSTWRWATK